MEETGWFIGLGYRKPQGAWQGRCLQREAATVCGPPPPPLPPAGEVMVKGAYFLAVAAVLAVLVAVVKELWRSAL